MGLKKGQTNNTSGRPKGTPNKVTTDLRKWVECLIDRNLKKMERDLKQLEPRERLMILEKLLQYSIPKQQSISVEAQIQAEYASLEKLLSVAPDEAVKEITERVIRLNSINSKKDE
jgi:hypothetical protein